jgi:hypothetical protein
MAEFEIVQPVEGAPRVTFDYQAASTAIDTLVRARTLLTEQLNARVGPRDAVIVNWEGYFRDEFLHAWGIQEFYMSGSVETVVAIEGQIYTAIQDANDMQRTHNHNAEGAGAPAGPR